MSTQLLTAEDIKKLAAPFSDKVLGIKAQSFNRDRNKVMLVPYIQHTDTYARLETVDPAWQLEVVDSWHMADPKNGEVSVFVAASLTVKGVSRSNVGAGEDYKNALSDAVKRCAMLFGVGRYLYDSGTSWVPYNEQTDKYREWTYADYNAGLHGRSQLPTQENQPKPPTERSAAAPPIQPNPPAAQKPAAAAPKGSRTRDQINQSLMGYYMGFMKKFPSCNFPGVLAERYQGVCEWASLSVAQLEDLEGYLKSHCAPAAPAPTAPGPAPEIDDVKALRASVVTEAKRVGLEGAALVGDVQARYKKTPAKLAVGEMRHYINTLKALPAAMPANV